LIEKKLALPLREVVQASHQQFYAKSSVKVSGFDDLTRGGLFYSESYTLMHLLLSRDDGRQRVRDYVRALAKDHGQRTAKITQEFFGPDVCERLTPFWVEHVKSRPENR
jgi:hypothetical protein